MAGVTETVFRTICKDFGADVVVTEFVSAEGIFRRNARTLEYLEFSEDERPLGVQLFGADPDHLGEAARMVLDWKRPDFIDLNFGCPVNKVVSKQGGSALLRDCPLLERVTAAVVRAVAPHPVTVKIRTGWDAESVNAPTIARRLEDAGVRAIAVHGRTKAQGYSGEADWDVIGEVVQAVRIPVIGNGDLTTASIVEKRRRETGIAGAMIGRAAMSAPWVFRGIKHLATTGVELPDPPLAEQWQVIRRHCARFSTRRGGEIHAMHAMRSRLMAYSRSMPGAKQLRQCFQQISTLAELDEMAARHLAEHAEASVASA